MIIVDIVTPDHLVVSVGAYICLLPGVCGVLGVLEKHEPMVIALMAGEVVLHSSDGGHMAAQGEYTKKWRIDGGIARTDGNICAISVLECEEIC